MIEKQGPVLTIDRAKSIGAKNYFTGDKCKNGHIDYRQVSNRTCHTCRKIAVSKLPDGYYCEYRKKNSNRLRKYGIAYSEKNKEAKLCRVRNYRARKRNAAGSHTKQDVLNILAMQKNKCAEPSCRASLNSGYHVDHITPLSRGGSNDKTNIQCLCPTCNFSKSATPPDVLARKKGRLL